MSRRITIVVTIAFLAIAPAGAADLTPRQRGNLAIQARAILNKYCSECHNKEVGTFDALNYSHVMETKRPIPFVSLEKQKRSQIIEFIEDGSMPPGGRERPTPSEIEVLKNWMKADVPRYPKSFDYTTTLQTVLDDWKAQKTPGTIRHISIAPHNLDHDHNFKNLDSEQLRLQKALDAATTKKKSFALQHVDDAATVFRIDIEKLGWTTVDLFEQLVPSQKPVAHPIIPFDLILLEKPFGFGGVDPGFETVLATPKHVRPIAFLPGDWLSNVLAPGTPLAADMKSLVELAEAVEKGAELPCGPKVRAFEKSKSSAPTGAQAPITAWYGGDRDAPFKLEFAVKGNTMPTVVLDEAIPLEVKSDRAAKFRLFNVLSDGSIRIQPVAIGNSLKKNETRVLATPAGTPITIPSLIAGGETGTEHFILIAAEEDVPMPTIVRSVHATFGCKESGPVYRILFDKDPKFDPSKAVRKIITVNVTRK